MRPYDRHEHARCFSHTLTPNRLAPELASGVALSLWVVLAVPVAHAHEISVTSESLDASSAELPPVVVESSGLDLPGQPVGERGSPQSFVSEKVIREMTSSVGDYGIVVNLTPGFVSSSPNGPGFDAAKGQTLRGFVDGQFNVTMDGVPVGDPDNFAHHSTSFFPATLLDHAVVDRSPGAAADLGYASFGGTINLYSITIPQQDRLQGFLSYGSFNTVLAGATLNSAAPAEDGQIGALLSAETAHSDGAMANSPGNKSDFFLKVQAIWGALHVTAVASYDNYHFYNPGNITTAQLAAEGSSAGYNRDPASPNDYAYSATERRSDFDYLRFESALGNQWSVTDRLYTYSYHNTGLSLKGDQTSSAIGSGFSGVSPSDIAGRLTQEDYRTVGNDLHVERTDTVGTLRAGLWVEHSQQTESRVGEDLSTGLTYNVNKADHSPVYFDFDARLRTVQPYLEYDWHAMDPLNVRFGVRYRDVTRDFDASVVQNFLPGTAGTITKRVTATLPSVDATYRISDTTNVLAQFSQGSLVPSQAFFYTTNPAAGNQANAETALAYQIGLVHQTADYGVGVDAFLINFDNYVSTITENNATVYVNSGKVRYQGAEAEGHLALGHGVSLIANGSVLEATFQQAGMTSTGQHAGDIIPYAPTYTGLLGFIYERGPWSASLLSKFVGSEFQGKNGSADGTTFFISAYHYTNATVTRKLSRWLGARDVRITAAINNLENLSAITDNAGPSKLGPTLVNTLPRLNASLSIIMNF